MDEKIELQKLKEEYPDFFTKTPPEVIDFVLSEETAKKITDICEKNRVGNEEKIESIAYRIALVLLGKLPRESLALTLELGVDLTAETAKKIYDEANQFIFSRLSLLKAEKAKAAMPQLTAPPKGESEEKPEEKSAEEPKRPRGKDVYREPVE